jgi:hypothetical protein
MGYCWYCTYGWPKQIADIYHRHEPTAGESAMHYGPAHVVWDDENFERESVQWCLDHFDDYRGDHSNEALEAVRKSLVELLELPDDVLVPRPDYDNEHPDEFPPPPGMEMVRV